MNSLLRRSLWTAVALAWSISPALSNELTAVPVNPWMILPFGLLLLAIAVAPFINRHWWERYYPAVALTLGAFTTAYYVGILGNTERMVATGMEYFSFICLIGSLFVVAGGVHIRIKGRSTPLENVFLLSIGAIAANIVGTTGASMILIRPYIRVNKFRIKPFHIVFFIFIVSNMGGALTPIGDPPLFLGYLKGIPFFWVAEVLWGKWLVAMLVVIGIFYLVDLRSFNKLPVEIRQRAAQEHEEGEASGIHNVLFLAVIMVAVFISNPVFVREALMIAAAVGSYLTTKHEIHKKNDFNFLPIKEVSILFLGIFATMVPALDWLTLNASGLGITTAGQFYWTTGLLSAFLDNAPTYLNFLSAAIGLHVSPETMRQLVGLVNAHGVELAHVAGPHAAEIKTTILTLMRYHFSDVVSGNMPVEYVSAAYLMANHSLHVQAISLAAVFFGACTYIGNGPNFMVKSIAEQSGVKCPTFFGYITKYSLPVLIPLFALIWLLFFTG